MSPFLSIENLERQASQVLHDAGFDGELPVDPIEIAKTMGLSVHLAKFSDENTAGILRIDGENASIFVRSTDSPNRQRFTVAHELGHYVLHRREESDFVDTDISVAFLRRSDGDSESDRARRRRETQANLFAAAPPYARVFAFAGTGKRRRREQACEPLWRISRGSRHPARSHRRNWMSDGQSSKILPLENQDSRVLSSEEVDSIPTRRARRARPVSVRSDDLESELITNFKADVFRLEKSLKLRDLTLLRFDRRNNNLTDALSSAQYKLGKLESLGWRWRITKSALAALSLAGGVIAQCYDKADASLHTVFACPGSTLFAVGIATFIVSGLLLLALEVFT